MVDGGKDSEWAEAIAQQGVPLSISMTCRGFTFGSGNGYRARAPHRP